MKGVIGKCRLCGQVKQLIRAHSISRRFFAKVKGAAKFNALFDANKPPKAMITNWQAGVYDTGILCEGCERKFSDFDSYGWKILGNPLLTNPVYDASGTRYAYRITCNTDQIRRFILAVLWRASVSSQSFYSEVNLGPYESQVKRRLFYPTRLKANEFLTVMLRLETQVFGPYKDVLFFPFKGSRHGLNIHTLFLPEGLKIMVITGRGKFPPIFQYYSIRDPDSFLLVECPKEFMRETDYIPAAIERARSLAHADLSLQTPPSKSRESGTKAFSDPGNGTR
jgi:hypothetical protein